MSETVAQPTDKDAVMREIASMKQRITELEEDNERKEQRIDELEAQLDEERERRQSLINTPEEDAENTEPSGVFIAGKPIFSMFDSRISSAESIEDAVKNVKETLRQERQKRGSDDAYLQKQITSLSEHVGIEISDSDIMGDDKIRRAMKNGAADVENNHTKTDERAVTLLRNIDRWGNGVNDKNGKRFLITASVAKDRFKDATGDKLQTTQINRVFDKVEEWAEDSPREARTDYTGERNKLAIFIEGDA